MHQSSTAIIIGSGVAGMAAAIRLAVKGYAVTVYESNGYPGGKLSHFEKEGFRFDAGPSLFTQPELITELFALAGDPMEAYFCYQQHPTACTYFWEDGTTVRAFTEANAFAKEMETQVGESPEAIKAYLQASAKVYENIGRIFLNYSLHKTATLFNAPIKKALATVQGKLLFQTLHEVNKASFKHPHTVQLFNRYATFNGSNPYAAPGMLSLIPHLDHNIGTYYPKGGMISITNALQQLAIKKGVQFQLNTKVEGIIQVNNKAVGVRANGENHFSDMVVSNMDVYFTYKHLLNDEQGAKQILRQERSSSAFIFYWGMNARFPQLDLHNIFFAEDYRAEFNALFETKTRYSDPTVYINITSKCEPGVQAPEGKENWFVMVNAPANVGQDWEAYRKQYKQAIIQKLNRLLKTDIAPLIAVEEVLTPVTIEARTASFMGSLYGTSSNSKMAAFLRHPNFNKDIANLYFVGGSVHPGGGIPLCLQSARIVGEMVR